MNNGRPLRISCPNFAREEVDALKSLVGLLKPYLKRPFAVDGGVIGDIRFVNLDNGGEVAGGDAIGRTVGCATRPRMHGSGTIHRPWRVSEVLAVLSEAANDANNAAAARREASAAAPQTADNVEWTFRLRVWPLAFEQLPKRSWRVLASITHEPLSVAEIAARTELEQAEVDQYLQMITAQGALERLAAPVVASSAAPAPQVSKWRSLAGRIGRILGFQQ